jgi:hypothetical protein
MKYFMQPRGTVCHFKVTGTPDEVEGELLSLQNKGAATKPLMQTKTSFVFSCASTKIKKIFLQQVIMKCWNDEKLCREHKGKTGGFYQKAVELAKEKFQSIKPEKRLYNYDQETHYHSVGEVKAEKPCDDWENYLTSILQRG